MKKKKKWNYHYYCCSVNPSFHSLSSNYLSCFYSLLLLLIPNTAITTTIIDKALTIMQMIIIITTITAVQFIHLFCFIIIIDITTNSIPTITNTITEMLVENFATINFTVIIIIVAKKFIIDLLVEFVVKIIAARAIKIKSNPL